MSNNFESSGDDIDINGSKEYSPDKTYIKVYILNQLPELMSHEKNKLVFKGYNNDLGTEISWNSISLTKISPSNSFKSAERKRLYEDLWFCKTKSFQNVINIKDIWLNKKKLEIVYISEYSNHIKLSRYNYLSSYLKKIKRPKLRILRNWCKSLLKAIESLHSANIIHRRISSSSIWFNNSQGEILLGDLECACQQKNLVDLNIEAPELFGNNYSFSSDLYSLGIWLLEIITEEKPFSELKSPIEIFKAKMSNLKPKSLDKIQIKSLKKLILDCLNDQNKRPSISELFSSQFFDIFDEPNSPKILNQLKNKFSNSFIVDSSEPNSKDQCTMTEINNFLPGSDKIIILRYNYENFTKSAYSKRELELETEAQIELRHKKEILLLQRVHCEFLEKFMGFRLQEYRLKHSQALQMNSNNNRNQKSLTCGSKITRASSKKEEERQERIEIEKSILEKEVSEVLFLMKTKNFELPFNLIEKGEDKKEQILILKRALIVFFKIKKIEDSGRIENGIQNLLGVFQDHYKLRLKDEVDSMTWSLLIDELEIELKGLTKNILNSNQLNQNNNLIEEEIKAERK